LRPPEPDKPLALELDEVWSFVGRKARPAWLWVALDRTTRQVVAWALGDRSQDTCQELWDQVPQPWRKATCYTDFWGAYQAVIPAEQQVAVGKESGETAHIERWNNTLRQRLGRFVRKTLSFSKSDLMHGYCIELYLHDYNGSLASP
jgi:insertion element IS1 protein InsB